MKKLISVITLLLIPFLFIGCMEKVKPAEYGKKYSGSGYSPELLTTGRHWVGPLETMAILDASTNISYLDFGVTMKDTNRDGSARIGLEMLFQISLRYKIRNDERVINAMFNDIKITDNHLSGRQVFAVYGENIVLNKAREILSLYTPEEVLSSREAISIQIANSLVEIFKNKPIEVSDILITKMVVPSVIEDRIKANKDKELKMAEAEAQQAIDVAKRDNEIILAQKEAEKRIIDAKAAATENNLLKAGLDEQVLKLREIEVRSKYADAWTLCMQNADCGKNTIYMPMESISSTAAQMRMYQK